MDMMLNAWLINHLTFNYHNLKPIIINDKIIKNIKNIQGFQTIYQAHHHVFRLNQNDRQRILFMDPFKNN